MSRRTIIVSTNEAGRTLSAVMKSHLKLSWSGVRRLVQEHRVTLQGKPCTDPSQRVERGQRVEVVEPMQGNRPSQKAGTPIDPRTPKPIIRYVDAQVVVVEKTSGLTTMRHTHEAAEFGKRASKYLPPTLADLLPSLLKGSRVSGQTRVRAVHRLDNETSGLVVFARTAEAERHLGKQFRAHTIERRYLAVVRGQAKQGRIESHLVPDRGDGRRGSTAVAGEGQRAVTHVRVVEEFGGYALVECRLETGRTHQVRIHLGENGSPICGERVYDRPLHGRPVPDHAAAPRLALHAASLGFEHPTTGKRMRWDSPMPRDLRAFLGLLRKEGAALKKTN